MGPRDPSPYNLLDLVKAAVWAPPNLPMFTPLAPASTEAPVAAPAAAAGASPSPDDTAGSSWTSNRSSAPDAPAAAGPHTGLAVANPYLGSSAGADALDPARTRRLLERAKRDDDFVRWLSGNPGARPAQPMQYGAPAADAPRPGAPTTGIDDAVDQPAPVNRPPAFSSPQVPLFAAPRRPQGTYWSLLSPSGALLPVTQAGYQQPRAMADIQPAVMPAPAPPPDVPLSANNVLRSIATGIPIAGGLANKGNATINATLAPLMNPLFDDKNQLKGDTWSERYQNSLNEQNAADQAFHAAHPKLDTGLQIGGAMAATAPFAATATGARLLGLTGSLPGMVVRGGASNAAISAADAAVRGHDVPFAAGLGGLLGAGAPVVGRVVGAAAAPVIDRLRGIIDRSEEPARRAGSAVNRDAGQATGGTATAPLPPRPTPSNVPPLSPPEPRLALPPPQTPQHVVRGGAPTDQLIAGAPREPHTAYATHEFVPGDATGHLPRLQAGSEVEKAAYSRDPRASWAIAPGNRDAIYSAFPSRQVLPTLPTQGVFVNDAGRLELNPGFAARPVVSLQRAPNGGLEIAPHDRSMLNLNETLRGAVDAQEGNAVHAIIKGGVPASEKGSVVVPHDGPLTLVEATQLLNVGPKYGLPHVVDRGNGVTMTNFTATPSGVATRQHVDNGAILQDIKNAGLPADPTPAKVDSVYVPLADYWKQGEGSGAVTDHLLTQMRNNPQHAGHLDASELIPQVARNKLALDAERAGSDAVRQDVQNLREIIASGPGWHQRLIDAYNSGKVSLPALAAMGLLPALTPRDDARK